MRALQELIPNSNKVRSLPILFLMHSFAAGSFSDSFMFILQTDKASMLDEAIEYLKMLQVQLQVREGYILTENLV